MGDFRELVPLWHLPEGGVAMNAVRSGPLLAMLCLVAACGRVGEVSRLPAPSSLEKAAQAQPLSAPPVRPTESTAPTPALPSPDALTDSAITGRIQSALKADPAMSGADVSINTDKGVVVLSGTVKSHEQTGIASAHAQRQDGVVRVDNHLRPVYS
jgi:hyperosmotically inducible protein